MLSSGRYTIGRCGFAIALALVLAGTSAATAGASRPLIGAIRWDAWHPANTTSPSAWVTPKLYVDYVLDMRTVPSWTGTIRKLRTAGA